MKTYHTGQWFKVKFLGNTELALLAQVGMGEVCLINVSEGHANRRMNPVKVKDVNEITRKELIQMAHSEAKIKLIHVEIKMK